MSSERGWICTTDGAACGGGSGDPVGIETEWLILSNIGSSADVFLPWETRVEGPADEWRLRYVPAAVTIEDLMVRSEVNASAAYRFYVNGSGVHTTGTLSWTGITDFDTATIGVVVPANSYLAIEQFNASTGVDSLYMTLRVSL